MQHRLKYNRKPNRLRGYNYSLPGDYFVTICTKNREHFFGEIKNGIMGLSEIGNIANRCWQEIPKHFPDIGLDEYVVMPNHIHGIVIINSVGNGHVGDGHARSLQKLPVIIGSFKSAVTKQSRLLEGVNDKIIVWQKSYYDHIVRNERSFGNIQEYIINNPANWKRDMENHDCILDISKEEQSLRTKKHYDDLFY